MNIIGIVQTKEEAFEIERIYKIAVTGFHFQNLQKGDK